MSRVKAARILITGMSGTGKSSVVRELIARGFRAHDLDTPDWSEWVEADPSDDLTPADGEDWVWREDLVRNLLVEPLDGPLFVAGCASNQHRFYPAIDQVVLLSAPVETIMQRLEARHGDGYGSSPDERDKVARLIAAVEPLLRRRADAEIDTSGTVEATADAVIRAVGIAWPR